MKPSGMVYLVGAGPGDPELLTLRGAELLRRADVVVYDALVNTDLLRLAPKSAEIIYGGKPAREHGIPQKQLKPLLIAQTPAGQIVVRVKRDDAHVLHRVGEDGGGRSGAGG